MGETLDANTGEARRITAMHEAGHAVAVCMRRRSFLRSVHLGDVSGTGITYHRSKPCDAPFIAWAGCWAEARLAWGALSYDATDDEGCQWCDYLTGVFLDQRDDAAVVAEHFNQLAQMLGPLSPRDLELATEKTWHREMDRVWRVVQTVAERLLAGAGVNHELVDELLDHERALLAEGDPG